jgi:predicted RecA/RadA family phage recombinase
MRNFVQEGSVITLVAPHDVKSGDGVVVGAIFGVAAYDALAGAEVECSVEGVFNLPKAAGALAQGALVYWSVSPAGVAGSGAKLIGVTTKAAASGDTTVDVRLNESFS